MERIRHPAPSSSNSGDIVESLRNLLGRDVLLLPWPLGSKGTERKWGHLSVTADMSKPSYLAKLRAGNIGVALGSKSGGLCSIDIDNDDELPKFLDLNPAFRNSCITKGRRGGNIWVRIAGPFPPTKPLRIGGTTKERPKYGEWRSEGCQTIIHGIHPETQQPYVFLSQRPPVQIRFDEIVFPDYVFPKLSAPAIEALHREDSGDVSVVSVVSVKPVSVLSVKREDLKIKELIERCIPTKERDNHNNCLFRLARHVWTMQKNRRHKFSEIERRAIVQRWFDLTPAEFKRQTFEDYLAEFDAILSKVRCPIGDGRFDVAAKSARAADLPAWTGRLPTDDHRRLLVLCRELQRAHGVEPFFLGCRSAADFIGVHSFKTMAAWLRRFVETGYLTEEVKGGQTKETARAATRYFYKGKDL